MAAPVELNTLVPGVLLRVSRDKHCLFASHVHAETQLVLMITSAFPQQLRRAGANAVQLGTLLLLLAAGEVERLLAWFAEAFAKEVR